MVSVKSIVRRIISLQFVVILVVFCSFPLYAHILITEIIYNNNDQDSNVTTFVAISVETDDNLSHGIWYESERLFDVNKAFIRATAFELYNDEIFLGKLSGRCYHYCYLYISRAINNKGPP